MKPLIELYRRELQNKGLVAAKMLGWKAGTDGDQEDRYKHLLWMLDEMDTMEAGLAGQTWPSRVEAEVKLHRWLGFVQGVMWTTGIYSIDELRAHTRQAKGG